MEIGRNQGGFEIMKSAGSETGATDASGREQAARNAMNQLQARYGEKQKEARPIKKQLDKDDFMRIMITEMRHQDPTKPMDSDRMATQMAQITSVEQLKNVSGAIEKLSEKSSASDRLAMSAMIGKAVTVDKSRFSHQKGTASPVNFTLPEDAQKIKLTIMDERGEEVATRELEPMKSGLNVYNWDGINASNLQSTTGTYLVRVDAENAQGKKISVDSITRDRVVGVSFDGGETHFLVGDSKNPQKVGFKNVVRIESEDRADPAKGAQALRTTTRAPAEADEGATGSGSDALPPGLQEKLKLEMAQRKEEEPGGFPNGLSE
jgi:flagellar basal-body rod modification protein FlgD